MNFNLKFTPEQLNHNLVNGGVDVCQQEWRAGPVLYIKTGTTLKHWRHLTCEKRGNIYTIENTSSKVGRAGML